MKEVGIFEAKTKLSALLEAVAKGQTYVITNRGKPIAELRPIARQKRHLRFGSAKNAVVRIASDFDKTPDAFDDYT